MREKSASLSHPRRKVLHAPATSIAGSRNHSPRFFRRDFWYCCREKHWPIAERRVPSNDPRINCGTHIGSSFLLVFPFRAAEFSDIYWKHVVFHIRTVAGGPTASSSLSCSASITHTDINESSNRPSILLICRSPKRSHRIFAGGGEGWSKRRRGLSRTVRSLFWR